MFTYAIKRSIILISNENFYMLTPDLLTNSQTLNIKTYFISRNLDCFRTFYWLKYN